MGYKLLFSIVNQELIREDNIFLVNKTQKFVEAEFTFKTPEWDDLEKFAVFNIKGRSYTFPIGDNKICTITVPREALKSTHFRVSIFGGDMLTTNSVKILLGESGYSHHITPTGKREPEDIFRMIRRKLSKKFDKIEFKQNSMICYSDGEVVSIVPINESLFENYYSKEDIDTTLEEFESRMDEKLGQTVVGATIESDENTVYLKLIKYGEDTNG